MSREKNIQIYKENHQILKRNGYYLNGQFVSLPHTLEEHQKVAVMTPQKIQSIINDEDEFFYRCMYLSTKCKISVVNADSFAYPSDLVMNFANAFQPGGGYENGLTAQEETLCRQSTLYASIASKPAKEMYDYNREMNASFDSDYMLLSAFVDVFRDVNLNLLEKPYSTAVITIPAPNLNDRAQGQDHKKIAAVMKKRIKQYLYCAARYGYRNITLGAWGCGVFGHDAKNVAGYFRELLVDDKMWQMFDSVLFAVYDKTENQYNYNAFKELFLDVKTER